MRARPHHHASRGFARVAHVAFFACASACAFACGYDTVPSGDKLSAPGDGPVVKFDLLHKPLPDIPLPNDVATFPDPTSRTGRRLNASLVAPTGMERTLRTAFDDMEGWGTLAPITVAFSRGKGTSLAEPALDLQDFAARMQEPDFDFSNDPIYVINLTTGLPVFVDVGSGMYPVTLRDPWKYFPNDPKASEPNLVFETQEEGRGLTQADYRPELDLDFDGTLDHPNTLGDDGIPNIDNLMTWYERETDTLMLRPIIPLDEKTAYAVVITDRLRGANKKPTRSPFQYIHHPEQPDAAARVAGILSDKTRSNYFGDMAGTGLDHVSFVWTFTTQPIAEDLRLLRSGLYGKGPFARFATDFPTDATILPASGKSANPDDIPGWQNDPLCVPRAKEPYILKLSDPDVWAAFKDVVAQLLGGGKGGIAAIEDSLSHIDHLVIGTFKSPYLLGDPKSTDPDTRFHVNFQTGDGDIQSDDVPFFLAVPKADASHKQPFPVAFHGHGVTGHDDEVLIYGGDYARQGIALLSYDMPEHGTVLSAGDRALAQAQLGTTCLVPFVTAYQVGRANDYNGDGIPDSGWAWWTAHIAHTRDNVRQGILDGFQALRMLRSFDGKKMSTQDFNADGKPDLAGDFDGDGAPDVGGPNVPYFSSGESLGAIMSQLHGGVEPLLTATAQEGGGGGALAMDVAFRSYGVVEAVTEQILSPLVVSVPASERPKSSNPQQPDKSHPGSACTGNQRSVRFVVNEGDDSTEVEIACMEPEDLDERMTVVVTNVTNKEVRCARTGKDGRFRVPLPATQFDRVDVQLYAAPDVVTSYKGCQVLKGAPILNGTNARTGQPQKNRIQTFEQAEVEYPFPVADENKTCDAAIAASGVDTPAGCAQFRDVFFPVGSPLVAPYDGLGLQRQTPEFRRLRELAQAGFDPADPGNYAPYYMLRPLLDENGNVAPPRALLSTNTVGDAFVAIGAGHTFARAAGAVPFLPPQALTRYPEYGDYVTPQALYDALGEKTPMQALIDQGTIEGVFRLGRTHAGPNCKPNFTGANPMLCNKPDNVSPLECHLGLSDPDWVSEGAMNFDQPHGVPLRLGRIAGLHVTDDASSAAAWEPRLRGIPGSPDATAWAATAPVVGLFNMYVELSGVHTWNTPDQCLAWDPVAYGNSLLAHFFATGGKDVYYLSHPTSHACLAKYACDFFPQP
jgi:hypothetical protein